MKITIKRLAENAVPFQYFADNNELTVKVKEREPRHISSPSNRFYACFTDHVDIEEGHILKGVTGNGETPLKAIADLSLAVSGKVLAIRRLGGDYNSIKKVKAPTLLPFSLFDDDKVEGRLQ